VLAVSGKGLMRAGGGAISPRLLPGPESFRREILKGNLALPLERSGRCRRLRRVQRV